MNVESQELQELIVREVIGTTPNGHATKFINFLVACE